MEDTTKKPRCKYCREEGHYQNTCPKKKADIEAEPAFMPGDHLAEFKEQNPTEPKYVPVEVQRESMAPEMPKLPNRYFLFCEGLLNGMKQGEAYLAAGFDCKETSAATNASKALRRDDVRVYMSLRRKAITEGTSVTIDWWIRHNVGIANETHGMKETPASRSAAVERLGRYLGAYQKDRLNEADKRSNDDLLAALPEALETLGVKDVKEALKVLEGGKGKKKKATG